MIGAIRKWDILRHPWVTIRSFGWRVFFRSLVAGKKRTFLSLLTDAGVFSHPESAGLIKQCVDLELRFMRLYRGLAKQFSDPEPQRFFRALAGQEQSHAELLRVCHFSDAHRNWSIQNLEAWQQAIAQVSDELDSAEREWTPETSLTDALRLVLRLEASEINRLFATIVAATDSGFVRTLVTFRTAGIRHVAYLCHQISSLDPSLRQACRQLEEVPLAPLDLQHS